MCCDTLGQSTKAFGLWRSLAYRSLSCKRRAKDDDVDESLRRNVARLLISCFSIVQRLRMLYDTGLMLNEIRTELSSCMCAFGICGCINVQSFFGR